MAEKELSRWQQLDDETKKARQKKRQEEKQREPEKWQCYNKDYYRANKEHHAELRKQHQKDNPEKYQGYRKKTYARLRERIFALLGDHCQVCGFADKRALCIDHINGGGTKERRTVRDPLTYYRRILKLQGEGYQVLCANCNLIKRIEQEGYVKD